MNPAYIYNGNGIENTFKFASNYKTMYGKIYDNIIYFERMRPQAYRVSDNSIVITNGYGTIDRTKSLYSYRRIDEQYNFGFSNYNTIHIKSTMQLFKLDNSSSVIIPICAL